jgi:chemotaxis protein methyltransferase CheR
MGLERQEFAFLQQFMAQRASFILHEGTEYLAESRLTPLAYQEGMNSVQDLLKGLQRRDATDLHRKVLDAMVNNETCFFRDHLPFEALHQTILPELIAARAATRSLNLWSAASSSGQEAYSIAMLIAEEFKNLAGWSVKIIGTDISSAILERARGGRFSQLEVNRGLPACYLAKYFVHDGPDWVISPAIRNMVEFHQANLTEAFQNLPKFDVIFIRNVMIYFDVERKREIFGRLVSALQPDGFLILGAAESSYGLSESFSRVSWGKTAYYRPCT